MNFIHFKPKFQKKQSLYSPDDQVHIYAYFRTPGVKQWDEQSTGLKFPLRAWSQETKSLIQKDLNFDQKKNIIIFDQIKNHFGSLEITKKIDPSSILDKKKWLKDEISKAKGESISGIKETAAVSEYYLDWVMLHHEDKVLKDKVKSDEDFKRHFNGFKTFEKIQNKRIKLKDIDSQFEKIVLNYAKSKWPTSLDSQLHFLKRINSTCQWIINRQPEARKQLENYIKIEIPTKRTSKIRPVNKFTPTKEEVAILTNFTANTNWGEIVRKAYLLACKTGLRISDLLRIDPQKNIYEMPSENDRRQRRLFIAINPIKTETTSNKEIYPPISEQSLEVIKEIFPWRWKVDTKSRRTDANRKFNLELKKVFKDAGINRIIEHTHNRKGASRGESIKIGDFPAYEVAACHSARRFAADSMNGLLPEDLSKNIFGWGIGSDTSKNYLDPDLTRQKEIKKMHELVESAGIL
ncbi:hypothetical protein OAP99_02620 [Flavobacteriaceae bacterium]|nr:hypothetical protein [Flavobacteriaceae bacterium]